MSFKKIIQYFRQKLVNESYIEESLEQSKVPVILVLVMIWMVSAVLLLLSENRQRDLTVWTHGQRSPFSFTARIDFDYEDSAATEKARNAAGRKAPLIYRINANAANETALEIDHFLSGILQRERMEQDKKIFVPDPNRGSRLAEKVTDFSLLARQYRAHQEDFDRRIKDMLHNGIADDELVKNAAGKRSSRVISPDDKTYYYDHLPPAVSDCAQTAAELLKLSESTKTELIYCIKQLFGKGNLVFDPELSDKEASAASAAVKPIIKSRKKGDRLVERKQIISTEIADMLRAEKQAIPRGYGIILLCNRLGVSFLLLAISLFFLYRTYNKIFYNPRHFAIAGLAIIIGLLANYGAIQLFFYFFRMGIMPEYDLMLFMMPLPLGAALLSILLGNRVALFGGFLVAVLSSLMILPDRSLELALRWFAIVALMGFAVRNVSNYRSFFVRVLFGGFILTLLANIDMLFTMHGDIRLIKTAFIAMAANAFFCATAALLLVFAFELIFNMDTVLSLTVLGDTNNPLLVRMRREASGTMVHSLNVASLAEGAAAAINANSVRARVGALYHDIGRLVKPQYFVENNPRSPEMYEKMPPHLGCARIRNHVSDGLELAREYRLCRFIRDAIATHHGDDRISFFYELAKKQLGGNVLEEQYRYKNEPPSGKELTIIALADACEAASRSLKNPSPAAIEDLVNAIFLKRMENGQLRNSELTARELDEVRMSFIEYLTSIKHERIEYEKEEHDDTAAQPVDKPETAGTKEK